MDVVGAGVEIAFAGEQLLQDRAVGEGRVARARLKLLVRIDVFADEGFVVAGDGGELFTGVDVLADERRVIVGDRHERVVARPGSAGIDAVGLVGAVDLVEEVAAAGVGRVFGVVRRRIRAAAHLREGVGEKHDGQKPDE